MEISKNDFKVSTFKNYTEVNVPYHCDAKSLLERFKTDVNEIHKNRGFNKSDFDKFKKTLPIACFGGLFAKRSKNNLVKASGLMVLDFDDVKNIEEKKNELKSYDYIYSVFTSPSGKGIKALARIPIVKNDKEYKNYYRGIQKEIRGLDESGKDISRACFFSYDPEVYINEEVREFTKQLHEKTKILSKSVLEKNDYQIAGKVLRIIQYANVGERHTKVLSASRLMGGYVEAKKISYDEAVRLLEQEAYNIDPEDFQTNKKAIYDGLEDGMKNPLSNLDLDKEVEKQESEIKHGKIYYTVKDKEAEIQDLWENGQQRGWEIGFIDQKISIKEGCTTYIYSAPHAGKTQVLIEILVNLSDKYGLRHAIFSPESGGAAELYVEIIETVARSDFYNTYNNKMSEEQKKKAQEFVDSYFIVIDPDDGILTPEEFYLYVDIIERVYNVKVNTATADPWNELYHDFSNYNNREDKYLEVILGMVRKNARKNGRHNFILTHVTHQSLQRDESTGIRYYPIPTYREVSGGQTWSRKGQQMISVWRPPDGLCDQNGVPFEKNTTVLHIQKSKPKGIGELGITKIYYDAKKHAYYEYLDGDKFYPTRNLGFIKESKDQFEIPDFDQETGDVNYIEKFENEEMDLFSDKKPPF